MPANPPIYFLPRSNMRNRVRKIRRDQPSIIIKNKSKAIWSFLSSLQEYRTATTIGFYVAIEKEGEVDTIPMIEASFSLGKKICVPKIVNDKMSFFEIRNTASDLREGSLGILEPVGHSKILPKNIDLMIVPGIAFDSKGNRLGFGRGYYDRFLAELRNKTPIIAPAFDFQVVDRIPSSKKDVKVHRIVTETRIIDC